MEVKKLLFVNRRLSVGGSERVMTILANYMAEIGIETDMVVIQDMPTVYKVNDNVNVIQFSYDNKNAVVKTVKRLINLRKIIKEGNYDGIISFMGIINFYTLIAGFGHKNILVSERADPRLANIFIKFGRKLLYPFARKVVFQTEEAQKCFSKRIQKKSFVIPNPINSELPEPFRGKRSKEIVAIGRLTDQKNFKMAIDAFEKIYKEFPEYQMVIYGEGHLKNELEDYAKSKGVSVSFPGFVKDIIDKIKCSGIYISSSDFEGISNSMLEALAMGIPSVCTDCPVGGARMTIKNNVNGILIPTGDVDALYEGIKKIITDQAFADKISENAINIRKELSINMIGNKWLDVIKNN